MEKKKLNLATIESALANESLKVKTEDEKELVSLMIVDRINDEEHTSAHHSFLHGHSDKLSACIAMRMLEVPGFKDIIYHAVYAYEKNMGVKLGKAFEGIDQALGTLIGNLETILGEPSSGKKRTRKK